LWFFEIESRNRAKAGEERRHSSGGVSDVVKGPKTFNLNNVYVDATIAVVMGRKWENFDNWDALRNIYL
jgi:hypothetical protein